MDFLSHATIVGFMAGAATVVILQQLKGVLGLEHFTHKTDVIDVFHSIFTQTHQVYSNFYFYFFAISLLNYVSMCIYCLYFMCEWNLLLKNQFVATICV